MSREREIVTLTSRLERAERTIVSRLSAQDIKHEAFELAVLGLLQELKAEVVALKSGRKK